MIADLARMYDLVFKVPDGLTRLKELLEAYICNQGLEAIEKCCDAAINVKKMRELFEYFKLKVILIFYEFKGP